MPRKIYKYNLARDVAELERQRDRLYLSLKRLVDAHDGSFRHPALIQAKKVIKSVEEDKNG